VEFCILGPLDLRDGNQLLTPNGAKRTAVLGTLLLAEGGPVELGRLIEVVWGSRYPTTAAKQIRNAVSDLRRLGGARIRIELAGDGYRIDLANCHLDSVTFARHVERARWLRSADQLTEAAAELHQALSLWRGPVLAGLDSPALQPKIANLHQQRLTAFVEYAELGLIHGEQTSLLGELTEWAADNPLDERLTAQLMRAHFHGGAPALALMVYERARRTLRDELGVEPSPELQGLFHRILANERPADTLRPAGAR
jgi:DNA-binding SARP family transcriptional activator